jgi:hypothetical protein
MLLSVPISSILDPSVSFFEKGGPVMWPLLACSLLAMAVAIERLIYYWREHTVTRRNAVATNEAIGLAARGLFEEAEARAKENPSREGQLVYTGLAHRDMVLHEALETCALAELDKLRRGLMILDTIVTLAPMLGIPTADLLLLPLHVVLLELIIDPTCAIVLERQPAEGDIMERPPRDPGEPLLAAPTVIKSVLQGLVLSAACFGAYLYLLRSGVGAETARAAGIAILMLANVFLVQVNCSNRESALRSLGRLLRDRVMWIAMLATVMLLLAVLYTPLCAMMGLAPLPPGRLLAVLGIAALSVLWYEAVKWCKRKSKVGRGSRKLRRDGLNG